MHGARSEIENSEIGWTGGAGAQNMCCFDSSTHFLYINTFIRIAGLTSFSQVDVETIVHSASSVHNLASSLQDPISPPRVTLPGPSKLFPAEQ
jgi:hypothetical protein